MRALHVLIPVLIFLLAPAMAAAQKIIYVKDIAQEDRGDGSSWDSPQLLLAAFLLAEPGDQVWVAEGTYEYISTSRMGSFKLKSGVAIYGGFRSDCTAEAADCDDLGDRDWEAYPSVLSGDIDGDRTLAGNSYHVVKGENLSATTVLDGFTITGGYADGLDSAGNPTGQTSDAYGGGFYNVGAGSRSNPTLRNLTFVNNRALIGGALFNDGSAQGQANPTLVNVTFSQNEAAISGGAVYNYSYDQGKANPSFTNVRFYNNRTTSSSNSTGGAIYNDGRRGTSSPFFDHVVFFGNQAHQGGAVFNDGNGGTSSPSFFNVTFAGNTALAYGGAVYNRASVVADVFSGKSQAAFTNSILWGNSAGAKGAEVYNLEASPVFWYSLVQGGCGGTGTFQAIRGATQCKQSEFDGKARFVDLDGGDLRLGRFSAAIDAGENAFVKQNEDVAGQPRFRDDPGIADGGSGTAPIVDLGAYEYQETSVNTTVYVDAAARGADDGTSWADAFTDLQNGLAEAAAGDEVWVAKGTYYPTSGTDRSVSFELVSGVGVYGGFDGTETARDERDWAAHPTTLSGDIGQTGELDDSYHVLVGKNLSAGTVLDGFTVAFGLANGTGSDGYAGGLYLDGTGTGNASQLAVQNVMFFGNFAIYGGAVFIHGVDGSATLHATNVSFDQNYASKNGGVVYNWSKNGRVVLTLSNARLNGNTADKGGAIFNDGYEGDARVRLVNVTATHNSATQGAVIYASGAGGGRSDVEAYNSIFWGNVLLESTGRATVQYSVSGASTFAHSIIEGGCDGTGFLSQSATVTCGAGNLDEDPRFTDAKGVDRYNGTADDDLTLGVFSPAIDAGDNGAVTTPRDLAGNARFRNDPGLADTGAGTDPIVDMGAYEFQGMSAWYVDADAVGASNGASWADAFTDVRAALAAASAGEEIWVAEGTYRPVVPADANAVTRGERSMSFVLDSGVALYGGFDGTETARDHRDWVAHPTVLSGDIGRPGDVSDNSYHVLVGRNLSAGTVIDGFTITGGNANGSEYSFGKGGGFYNDGSGSGNESRPTIRNVTFTANAAVKGGAVYNYGPSGTSSPSFTNVTFHANTATNGGAVYNDGASGTSSPSFTNVTFHANTATKGGAMFNYSRGGTSSPSFTNVTFHANTATKGGAMFNYGGKGTSSPSFVNSILWGNTADDGYQMYNAAATPSLSHTLVEGGCNGGGFSNSSTSASCGAGNLWRNPRFADAANGNLRLSMRSPAIDAGNNAAVTSASDLAGMPRVVGTVDLGAYEMPPPASTDETPTVGAGSGRYRLGATGATVYFHTNDGTGTLSAAREDHAPPGTGLPSGAGGTADRVWSITTTLTGDFTYEACFDLSGLGIADWDAVSLYKTNDAPPTAASVWVDVTTLGATVTVSEADEEVCVSGLTAFSSFTPGSGSGALPVELTAFDAVLDGQAVALSWSTASETNNTGFDVEWRAAPTTDDGRRTTEGDAAAAADSLAWTVAGFVEGHGTTTEAKGYGYRVEGLLPGRYVFRLRQVDYDGQFAYSPVVEATVGMAEAYLLSPPWPNPARGAARLNVAVREGQPVAVAVYDALGRRVAVLLDEALPAGEGRGLVWDAGRMAAGVYFVRLRGRDFAAVEKLVIVR